MAIGSTTRRADKKLEALLVWGSIERCGER